MEDRATIIKNIFIKAPPKAVFELLTNPVKIIRWMGPQTKLGVRGGSMWRLGCDGRATVRGKCLKLQRYRKVMFTWGWTRIGQRIAVIDSVVVISLRSRGEGTWVQLIHRKLPRAPVEPMNTGAGFRVPVTGRKTILRSRQ